MQKSLWKLSCLGTLVAALVGCSDAVVQRPGDNQPVAVTEQELRAACTSLYAAMGETATRCVSFLPASYYAELAEKACPEMVASVLAGRQAFEKSKLDACIADTKALDCDERYLEPASCKALLQGKVAEGGDCFLIDECQGDGTHYCRTGDSCPGTCTAYIATGAACTEADQCEGLSTCIDGTCLAPGGDGDDCFYGMRTCEDGLYCNTNDIETTCVPLKAKDAECMDLSECANGLTCAGIDEFGENPGTCQPFAAEGATCAGMYDCVIGLYCQGSDEPSAAKTCVKPKKVGESCTFGNNDCQAFASCDPDTNKCVARAELGETCGPLTRDDAMEWRSCAEGYCDTQMRKCTAFKAPGESCTPGQSGCEFGCGQDGKCSADSICRPQ